MRAPTNPKDPRDVSVQIQFRAPFWYRELLARQARDHDMNLSQFCAYLVEKQVEPVKPAARR